MIIINVDMLAIEETITYRPHLFSEIIIIELILSEMTRQIPFNPLLSLQI